MMATRTLSVWYRAAPFFEAPLVAAAPLPLEVKLKSSLVKRECDRPTQGPWPRLHGLGRGQGGAHVEDALQSGDHAHDGQHVDGRRQQLEIPDPCALGED